jgi:hypothetical protein
VELSELGPTERVSPYLRTPTPVEVEVTLRLTVSQSVCLGIEYPCWTCDQILFPVEMLLSEICGLVSIGRPLCREVGSAIYKIEYNIKEAQHKPSAKVKTKKNL